MLLFRADKFPLGCYGNIRMAPAFPVQLNLLLSLCISAKQKVVLGYLIHHGTFFMDSDQEFIYIVSIARIYG